MNRQRDQKEKGRDKHFRVGLQHTLQQHTLQMGETLLSDL